jgi:V8-like Glu-specific endopeptidase
LHPRNNPNGEDASFLNAVGAVWPHAIDAAPRGQLKAVAYDAATGFLIDQCHVLTSMHVVYTDDVVVNPEVGNSVTFGVGQTESDTDRGALQGLKFLVAGTVIAHGTTNIVDRVEDNPENDWAVIRLAANVDGAIAPMPIAAVDAAQLPAHFKLAAAGFPTDHRRLRGNGFKLKDLWGSEGEVVGVVSAGTTGALVETTMQITPGNSGGPVYGDFNGRKHIVVGIVQGFAGNGIDVSAGAPNTQVLLTPGTLVAITRAREQSPCP